MNEYCHKKYTPSSQPERAYTLTISQPTLTFAPTIQRKTIILYVCGKEHTHITYYHSKLRKV